MLTRTLARYRTMSGNIKPLFIDPEDASLLEFTRELLKFYRTEGEPLRGEIEEAVLPIVKSMKDLKLAKGIHKIILDRCEFSAPEKFEYAESRRKIFRNSAELIRMPETVDYLEFKKRMTEKSAALAEFIEHGIYSDLPENEKLISVKETSPTAILQRYNMSLVQTLLLSCSELNISLEEPEPSKMRRLFKYLRFFRLLAEINTASQPGKKTRSFPKKMELTINGPASLFENTQKYGFQLASFFPAICGMDRWKIDALIKIDDRELKLRLDSKSGLISHFRNFGIYIPEEISMFHKLFEKKSAEWDIDQSAFFLDTGDQKIIFPDFSFRHKKTGTIIHLELFHRWHSQKLAERLEFCERHPDLPLITGIDRFLYKKEIAEMADGSDYFENSGFLFRDFPGVDTVLKVLDKRLKTPESEKATEQPGLGI